MFDGDLENKTRSEI